MKYHDVFMRTTLNISDALLNEIRQQAAEQNKSFRETLEETLQRGLSAPHNTKPIRIQTASVGVKPVYQGLSMNQLYDHMH